MQAAAQLDQPENQSDLQLIVAPEPAIGGPAAYSTTEAGIDASRPVQRDNLPEQNGLLIGRRAETERCLAALDPAERGWGVIISGMGGIGKTALAIEAARQARAAQLFDAYAFVSASTSWQPPEGQRQETLAHSSLDAFVRESLLVLGDHDPATLYDPAARRQALLSSLQQRRTLLVWDNLESLVDDERTPIVEFLRRLPIPTKAIVTSRAHSGAGAVELQLEGLSAADLAALREDLAGYDPHIGDALQNASVDTRRKLELLVDGNPLALKMALGLLAQTGCALDIVVSRLRDPVRSSELYKHLFGDALASLPESDQALLSALVAFRAGAGVEALADITGLALGDVARGLERLAKLALVAEPRPGCYRLHPLARTYVGAVLGSGNPLARAALGPAKLDPATQRRALHYWVDFATRHQTEAADARAFAQLDLEWPNLEAAAIALRELSGLPGPLADAYAARQLNDLSKALSGYLGRRGMGDEQARLGEWAYEAACALEGWQSAGWRAHQVAWAHYGRADFERAAVWADRMAAAMARAGNRRDRAAALRLQGLVAEQQGQVEAAERLFVESLATYRELKIPANQVAILCDLGSVAQRQKQLDRADGYYQHALELAEQLGSQEHQALCANNLGLLWLERGRPAQARSWYERGRNLALAIGRDELVAFALSGLARVLEGEYRYREALELAEQALALQERAQTRDREATRQLIARLHMRAGDR